jgi:carnosine N-methyltransferase
MWDCVVTCFFIDTAHNVIDYLICINKILKVGGLWVNLGPLLWHYADLNHEMQIELTCEEVLDLVPKCGFKLRRNEFRKCTYTQKLDSMSALVYDSIFFSAVKVADYVE